MIDTIGLIQKFPFVTGIILLTGIFYLLFSRIFTRKNRSDKD